MPNKQYVRGRTAEYKTIAWLKKQGYVAQRSAGSHGLWDVLAYDAKGWIVVQSKQDCEPGKAELVALANEVVPANTVKLLLHWVRGKGEPMVTEVA